MNNTKQGDYASRSPDETPETVQSHGWQQVSIRVRAEARTKHEINLISGASHLFQSASEPKPGRNVPQSQSWKALIRFNPRPSRSPDET